jgi:hypothetical protein
MDGMPTGLQLLARWDEYFGLFQVQEDTSRLCPFPTSAFEQTVGPTNNGIETKCNYSTWNANLSPLQTMSQFLIF